MLKTSVKYSNDPINRLVWWLFTENNTALILPAYGELQQTNILL